MPKVKKRSPTRETSLRRDLVVVGIDPGASGGICVLVRGEHVSSFNTPDTVSDALDLFRDVDHGMGMGETLRIVAYMEKVGGYAGVNRPGSRMFNFGRGVGILETAVASAGIRLEFVTPGVWQKHFSINRKPDEKDNAFKNRLKAKAQQLHPKVKVTLKTADALLIATYGHRNYRG